MTHARWFNNVCSSLFGTFMGLHSRPIFALFSKSMSMSYWACSNLRSPKPFWGHCRLSRKPKNCNSFSKLANWVCLQLHLYMNSYIYNMILSFVSAFPKQQYCFRKCSYNVERNCKVSNSYLYVCFVYMNVLNYMLIMQERKTDKLKVKWHFPKMETHKAWHVNSGKLGHQCDSISKSGPVCLNSPYSSDTAYFYYIYPKWPVALCIFVGEWMHVVAGYGSFWRMCCQFCTLGQLSENASEWKIPIIIWGYAMKN